MQTKRISALPAVRVLGRTNADRDVVTLFWTASGLELIFTGSELWLELNADYSTMEPWISIELNGAWLTRCPVNKGASELCVFRNMTPGAPKHVRIFKDTQAMHDDPAHLLQITGLRYDGGEFLPLPAPACRLEFVGDSITSGEGTIGALAEEDWISAFFTAENHYARMTADALNAEYRIVSQSGWGLVTSWDNDPTRTVPTYYEQICGLAEGPVNAACGAKQPYDFAAWPADAVMINLGTNDDGAFHNPPFPGNDTTPAYKQRLAPDGTPLPQDAERLIGNAVDFYKKVRRSNPQAAIVWCYGMLGDWLMPLLQTALERYKAESGDKRAYLLPLPNTTQETVGARQHPGVKAHQAAAEVLTAFLRDVL